MYVTERWLGGLLTNFQTVKKQVRRLKELEAGSEEGGEFENYTKKEQLMLRREREKLSKYLDGIRNMGRLPGPHVRRRLEEGAHRASTKRNKLSIPIIAIVDTNADPGSHHGADRRQRRRDSLGRADHEGDRRRDRRSAPRSAGRARKRKRARSYTYSSDRGAEPAGEDEQEAPSPPAPSPRQARSDRRPAQGDRAKVTDAEGGDAGEAAAEQRGVE